MAKQTRSPLPTVKKGHSVQSVTAQVDAVRLHQTGSGCPPSYTPQAPSGDGYSALHHLHTGVVGNNNYAPIASGDGDGAA